jgi:hypothetical protein
VEHHRARAAGAFYLVATAAGKPLYDAVAFKTAEELEVQVAGESVQFATHCGESGEARLAQQ